MCIQHVADCMPARAVWCWVLLDVADLLQLLRGWGFFCKLWIPCELSTGGLFSSLLPLTCV
jgi:hypothetical protein